MKTNDLVTRKQIAEAALPNGRIGIRSALVFSVVGLVFLGPYVTGTPPPQAVQIKSRIVPASSPARPESTGTSSLAIFNKRILPILQTKNRSSCFECHFSGVDLKDYIHETQEETFASLRKAGMIDLEDPDHSKILEFIRRKPSKPNPISEKARRLEFQAFRAWIHAAVKNPQLLQANGGSDVGIRVPVEIIRHARKDRVLARFMDTVWSQMGRCVSCHAPGHNQKLVERYGERVNWIVPNNPKATFEKIVRQDLVDVKHPEKSPFLLKPAGLMKHGGGPKFLPGDSTWTNYLSFLTDYAAMVKGSYTETDQLPKKDAEIAYLTKHFLRLTGVAEKYHKVPVRVDLYRWQNGQWSEYRWATSTNYVAGYRQFWQGPLNVTAPGNSKRAAAIRQHPTLPPGKYLAKIYMDKHKTTLKDPSYRLGAKEYVGEIEIQGSWSIGFKKPRLVNAPKAMGY